MFRELLQALTPLHAQKNLGITVLTDGVTPVQGFGIEYFLGFVLVLVVFGVCDVNRSEVKGLAPVAIGLTIAMGHLAVVSTNTVLLVSCQYAILYFHGSPIIHSATAIMRLEL
jgi:glycerol uptake facilitator-like aquaporin